MVFVPAPFAADAPCTSRSTLVSGPSSRREGRFRPELLRIHAFIQVVTCASSLLPRGALTREGERRDHSGRDLPGGARSGSRSGTLTYQIGHELTQLEAQTRRRRDRRRSDRGIVLPGDPRALRGRPPDGTGGHGRRDRGRRGGEGRGVHRGGDVEAGRRVHRRVHCAAGKTMGHAGAIIGLGGHCTERRTRSRPAAFGSARRRPRPPSGRRARARIARAMQLGNRERDAGRSRRRTDPRSAVLPLGAAEPRRGPRSSRAARRNGTTTRASEEILPDRRGRRRLEVDGDRRTVSAGDAILIPPGAWHELTAGADGVRLLCCCVPPYSDDDTFFVTSGACLHRRRHRRPKVANACASLISFARGHPAPELIPAAELADC